MTSEPGDARQDAVERGPSLEADLVRVNALLKRVCWLCAVLGSEARADGRAADSELFDKWADAAYDAHAAVLCRLKDGRDREIAEMMKQSKPWDPDRVPAGGNP
jgi:hypothetical protein